MSVVPFDFLEGRATRWRTAFHRLMTLGVLGVLTGTALGLWATARHDSQAAWIFLAATLLFAVVSISITSWYPTHRYGVACRSSLTQAWVYVGRTGRCKGCRRVVTVPPPPKPPPRVPRLRNPLIRSLIYLALVPFIVWGLVAAGVQHRLLLMPAGANPACLAGSLLGLECIYFAFIPLGLLSERLRLRRLAEDAPIKPPYPVLELVRERHLTSACYRVYFAPEKLCFARIAGSMHSENGAFSKGEGAVFLAPFLQRSLRQKRRREGAYDAIDPACDDLLAIDRRNFHLLRAAVHSLSYKPRYQMARWERVRCAPDAAGVVTVLADGKSARWLIYADLSPEEITLILESWLRDPRSLSCPPLSPPHTIPTNPLTPSRARCL